MVQCHGQMNRCWPADSDAPDWAADLDDWCALLRLDALLRLVPELRHDMPAVMRALEANTETELSKLFDVRRFELQDRRRADGFEYLLSTRMLQPGHREGWFGLLVDGRRELDPTSRTASAPTIDPLAALDLAVVSGEVYRYTQLFCALIDLGRIGHLQNDHLHPRGNFGLGAFDFNHAGFRASVPVRKSDTLRNRRDGLPSSWTSNGAIQRGTHALLHEWLCWVAVLATTERPARHEVLRQLPVWLSPLRAEQASHLLTRLVTTERMTHAEHWRRLDPTSQVDLMTQDAALGRRALYMVAMDDTHLHMVVRQLQAGTAPLHPRKALTVLGAFGKPGALGKYLGASAVGGAAPSPSTVLDKAAIALVWPAPVRSGATDSEWADALRDKTLTDVLRASWWENSVPQTWLSGWQRAAGNQLSTADCLQLLCRVAKEPGALGGHWAWSTDRLKPWLPIAADGEPRGWPVTLEAIRTEGQAWEGSGMSADADSWLIGLLVCAQLRWVPSALLLAGAEKAASAHDMHAAVWALLRLAPEPNEGGLVSATGPSGWVVRCLRHAKSAADRAEDSLLVEALARCFGIDEALVMLRDAGWPVPDVHDSEVPD
jgi:hypothetical protein